MCKWLLILIGCVVSLQIQAQSGFKPVGDMAPLKQQFAKAAQSTQSIQCDFVQEKNLSMLSDKIVSKGKFWFKKDNKVRMEYLQPSYYLLVINGKDIRIKDAQKENKVSGKNNKLFEQINKITVDCVRGTVLDNADFSTKAAENAQYYRLELTPVNKVMKEYFQTIVLLVDKQDYSVSKITMAELSGDDTTISFLHKQLNTNIPDAVFSAK
ncbi:Outer membrane lipoprotein-sorting protein [Chitinophaga ginsengisegetis]|uniref:Outer membrane lipoprotein-sorting protein n=1 Tax=Chitinophaga ginsengisegetis TaxID=393003 RepID=A0A1T5P0W5_9BACT|nr:outer membrane lipoprotein carrier protein LolA [Chitinophaga ginsengisegetis]MDR6567013.1 outer membrane lipoprotein-sorting protein [Chitinophaga ginsengisegetis]MDR6646743.1 outer membrane lipoprotein-sorting protein [Chitinophaga ginsengisegetis]MDR6653093.1 outer membrane lipoprotein-sorting protein [Chitinophaga ginsengisegetis]SKD05949.1 Outer membrane lipoprotein-sorting protein [Chitinophaga ginsengisegetis]